MLLYIKILFDCFRNQILRCIKAAFTGRRHFFSHLFFYRPREPYYRYCCSHNYVYNHCLSVKLPLYKNMNYFVPRLFEIRIQLCQYK